MYNIVNNNLKMIRKATEQEGIQIKEHYLGWLPVLIRLGVSREPKSEHTRVSPLVAVFMLFSSDGMSAADHVPNTIWLRNTVYRNAKDL